MRRLRVAVVLAVCLAVLLADVGRALTFSESIASPSNYSIVASDRALTASWSKPKLKTGQKLTGFLITASSSGQNITKTVGATATSIRFMSLLNGKKYRVSIATIVGAKISKAVVAYGYPKSRLQSNQISFKQPLDMFLEAPDQALIVNSLSKNVEVTSLTPTTCLVIGSKVRAKAIGDCILRASSAQSSTHLAATPVERLLTVGVPLQPIVRTLLWSEEFKGPAKSAPSGANWTADTTDGCGPPYNNCGWGNSERQFYLESASRLNGSNDGVLEINANRLGNDSQLRCYYGKCDWASGKITTAGKVSFTYGYIEARIKAPKGAGTWPAFWMLNTTIAKDPWPFSGELDVMEFKGSAPQITYGTVHYANAGGNHTWNGGTKDTMIDLSEDFHRYGMLWEPDEITFFVDDNVIHKVARTTTGLEFWPFGKNRSGADPKFYIILNLAMGGHFGGAVDSGLSSATLSIDWVRYYSVDGLGKVNK